MALVDEWDLQPLELPKLDIPLVPPADFNFDIPSEQPPAPAPNAPFVPISDPNDPRLANTPLNGEWDLQPHVPAADTAATTAAPRAQATDPYTQIRANYVKELGDPNTLAQVYNLTYREVGDEPPAAQQAFMETLFNRAYTRGKTLLETVNDRSYYPRVSYRPADLTPDLVKNYTNLAFQVVQGSDLSRGATGNASGTVGFNKGPQTAQYGRERYGTEGPDVGKLPGSQPGAAPAIARAQPVQPGETRPVIGPAHPVNGNFDIQPVGGSTPPINGNFDIQPAPTLNLPEAKVITPPGIAPPLLQAGGPIPPPEVPEELGPPPYTMSGYPGRYGPQTAPGMIAPGNIDYEARPVVHNKDGTVSTVLGKSFSTDKGEVLLPTIADDGRKLSDAEALAQYEQTGKHLGIFDSPEAATAFSQEHHAEMGPMGPRWTEFPSRPGSAQGVPYDLHKPGLAPARTDALAGVPFTKPQTQIPLLAPGQAPAADQSAGHRVMNATRNLGTSLGRYIFEGIQGLSSGQAESLGKPERLDVSDPYANLTHGLESPQRRAESKVAWEHSAEYWKDRAAKLDQESGIDPRLAKNWDTHVARALGQGVGMVGETMLPVVGLGVAATHGALAAKAAAENAGKTPEESDAIAARSLIGLTVFGLNAKYAAMGVAKLLPEGAGPLKTFVAQFVGGEAANETTGRALAAWDAATAAPAGQKMAAATKALTNTDLEPAVLNTLFAGMYAAHSAGASKDVARPYSKLLEADPGPTESKGPGTTAGDVSRAVAKLTGVPGEGPGAAARTIDATLPTTQTKAPSVEAGVPPAEPGTAATGPVETIDQNHAAAKDPAAMAGTVQDALAIGHPVDLVAGDTRTPIVLVDRTGAMRDANGQTVDPAKIADGTHKIEIGQRPGEDWTRVEPGEAPTYQANDAARTGATPVAQASPQHAGAVAKVVKEGEQPFVEVDLPAGHGDKDIGIANRLAEVIKMPVSWIRSATDKPLNFRGLHHEGRVFLNLDMLHDATRPIHLIAAHEIQHGLKFSQPKLAARLLDTLATGDGLQAWRDKMRNKYGYTLDKGWTDERLANELAPEFMAEVLRDPVRLRQAMGQDVPLMRRVATYMKEQLDSMIRKFGGRQDASAIGAVSNLRASRKALLQMLDAARRGAPMPAPAEAAVPAAGGRPGAARAPPPVREAGVLRPAKFARDELPPVAPADAPPGAASVPVMITRQMEADLRARGYTQEAINKMKPQEANDILRAPPVEANEPVINHAKYKHLVRKSKAGNQLTDIERQQVISYEQRRRTAPPGREAAVAARGREKAEFAREEPLEEKQAAAFQPVTRQGKQLDRRGSEWRVVTQKYPHGDYVSLIVNHPDLKRAGRLNMLLRDDGVATIHDIDVEPQFQRRGMGEALYREAGRYAEDRGIHTLRGAIISPEAERLRERVFPGTKRIKGGYYLSPLSPEIAPPGREAAAPFADAEGKVPTNVEFALEQAGAKPMKELPEDKPAYHVTYTKNVPGIKEKGLQRMQTSNWAQAKGGRYGDGEIYAFENLEDAAKWAGKMDWEFNKKMGSGEISIVKFKKAGADWEEDPARQSVSENLASSIRSGAAVPKENIITAVPFTMDRLVAMSRKQPQPEFAREERRPEDHALRMFSEGKPTRLQTTGELKADDRLLGADPHTQKILDQPKYWLAADHDTVNDLFPSHQEAVEHARTASHAGEYIVQREAGKPDKVIYRRPHTIASAHAEAVDKYIPRGGIPLTGEPLKAALERGRAAELRWKKGEVQAGAAAPPESGSLPGAPAAEGAAPIKEAAIRMPDGQVFTGRVHPEAEEKAMRSGRYGPSLPAGEPGFVDTAGKFLPSDAAAERAKQTKQMPADHTGRLEALEFNARQGRAEFAREEESRLKSTGRVTPGPGQLELGRKRANLEATIEGYRRDLIKRGGRNYPELRISTRSPGGIKPKPEEDPHGMGEKALHVDMESIYRDKDYTKKLAGQVKEWLPRELTKGVRDNRQILENAIEFMKRNKIAHYELALAYPWFKRAMKQYEGYNIRGHELAKKYGFRVEQVLGAESALSPQTPPDESFSMVERVMKVIRESGDTRWDARFDNTVKTKKIPHISPEETKVMRGKTFAELPTPEYKAKWARVYDQTFHEPDVYGITPEGKLHSRVATIRWRSFPAIAKGIRALQGERLSNLLDTAKISSYYNSKIAPNEITPDWVADTHDIGTSWMFPVHAIPKIRDGQPVINQKTGKPESEDHPLVSMTFNGAKNKFAGHHGVSALHVEAGNRAAAELGVIPNELQAGIWSHQQGFMSADVLRRHQQTIADIEKVWKDAARGKITENEARAEAIRLTKAALGQARPPTWDRGGSVGAAPKGAGAPGEPGELPASERPGPGFLRRRADAPGGAPPEFARELENSGWFHGSHEQLSEFAPRQVKSLDSLGTWFMRPPELAKQTYGPNVTRSDLPAGAKFLELDGLDRKTKDFHALMGSNAQLADDAGFRKEARILDKTRPNLLREGELQDRFNNDQIYKTPAEHRERQRLEKANDAAGKLLRNPEYMQRFRQMLQDQGYDGIRWRNSTLDAKWGSAPRDVLVLFHDKPIAAEPTDYAREEKPETGKPFEKVLFRGHAGEDPHLSTRAIPTYTDSAKVAGKYAPVYTHTKGINYGEPIRAGEGGRVGFYKVKMKNPLVLGHLDEDVVELGQIRKAFEGKVPEKRLENWIKDFNDSLKWRDDGNWTNLNAMDPAARDRAYTDTYRVGDDQHFVDMAKQAGYDGIIARGTFTSRPEGDPAGRGQGSYDPNTASVMEYRPFHKEQSEPSHLPTDYAKEKSDHPDKITDAYIQMPDGKRFYGLSHGHALNEMLDQYPELKRMTPAQLDNQLEEWKWQDTFQVGFRTKKGRHLDREDAAYHAEETGQADVAGEPLIAEDLLDHAGGDYAKEEQPPPGMKERGFAEQLRKDTRLAEEVRDGLGNRFYNEVPNKLTVEQALDWIKDKPVPETLNMIMDKKNDVSPRVRVAAGLATINRMNNAIDTLRKAGNTGAAELLTQRTIDLGDWMSEYGTEQGQGVQAFAIWNRLTPEGKLGSIKRTVDRARRSYTAKHQAEIDQLKAEVERLNQTAKTDDERKAELKKLFGVNKVAKRAAPVLDKLIKAAKTGRLTDQVFYDVVSERLGLPKYDRQVVADLTRMALAIDKAPAGIPRQKLTLDMQKYIATRMGFSAGDLTQSIWYGNMLSGLGTQVVNFVDTLNNTISNVNGLVLVKPFAGARIYEGMLRGFGRGLIDARRVLTGQVLERMKVGGPTSLGSVPTLELARFGVKGGVPLTTGPDAGFLKRAYVGTLRRVAESKVGYPLNLYKYVRRAMFASDSIMYHAAREARAALLAYRAAEEEGLSGGALNRRVREMMGNTPQQIETFGIQADREGLTGAERAARISELQEELRPTEARADAEEFAGEATYNMQPKGVLGKMSDQVERFGKLGGPANIIRILVVPFTRIAANVTNRGLNYTPWGFKRAMAGYWYDRAPTFDERVAFAVRASIGTGAMIGALALQHKGVLQVHGGGPRDPEKRNQLMENGWKPYTWQIGNHYISYVNTPMALPMGIIGSATDPMRYGELNKKQWQAAVAYSLLKIPNVIASQSFLSGMGNFFGAIGPNPDQSASFLKRLASGTAGNVLPRAVEDIYRIFDATKYDGDTLMGQVLMNTPFAALANKPALNAFGEKVELPRTFVGQRFWTTMTKDVAWQTVLKRGLRVPVPDLHMEMPDGHGGVGKRQITPDEYHQLLASSGPKVKQWILSRGMFIEDPVKLQDELNKQATAIREPILERLRRSARHNPVD